MEDLKRIYLDTSAYLAVLLAEEEALSVVKKTRGKIICTSVLTVAEVERNLVRLAREQSVTTRTYERAQRKLVKDIELFVIREISLDLCASGQFPALKTPRTSDLLHLRTALWFKANGGLHSFVSLDKNQIDAARELGLECA